MERLGVLGGTFDPPHRGHLTVAQAALQQLDLDLVLWAPAGQPPHKVPIASRANHAAPPLHSQIPSPPHHRLAMTRLTIAGYPQFDVCRLDLDRPGPHYSADLLDLLTQKYGPSTSFWFVVGEDSLRDLGAWHEPRRILAACRLAVYHRSCQPIDWASLELVAPHVRTQIDWLDGPLIELTSSEIRHRASAGLSIRHHVLPAVGDYILQHKLYRS